MRCHRSSRFASIHARLSLLLVMVTGLYALAIPAMWLLLRVASKVGALG